MAAKGSEATVEAWCWTASSVIRNTTFRPFGRNGAPGCLQPLDSRARENILTFVTKVTSTFQFGFFGSADNLENRCHDWATASGAHRRGTGGRHRCCGVGWPL